MGFWDVLGRMAQGKPAFEDPNRTKSVSDSLSASTTLPRHDDRRTPVDKSGRKIIPIIGLENCKSRVFSGEMETTVWAVNRSEYEVELDKIILLGTRYELDRRLMPRQSHEIRVFKGPVAKNDHYHTANLYYKQVRSDDYFQADFTIEYDYRPDGSYVIEEFHAEPHVRDI